MEFFLLLYSDLRQFPFSKGQESHAMVEAIPTFIDGLLWKLRQFLAICTTWLPCNLN